MGDILHFDDVTVRRGEKNILDSVAWSVADGQRWVILGPNGAGKTTMMQLASAYLHPTTGTVQILDERLGAVDVFELRPRIGISSSSLATGSAGECVLDVVLTAAYGMTGRWRETYEDVDESGRDLAAFGWSNRRPALRHSQRAQRVDRLFAHDRPEILILDEPGAGLDLGGRDELVAALDELAGDPASPVLILITHHVEEIPPGFTHALLLREGGIVAAGPITEVMTPQNLSTTFGVDLMVTRSKGRFAARALR